MDVLTAARIPARLAKRWVLDRFQATPFPAVVIPPGTAARSVLRRRRPVRGIGDLLRLSSAARSGERLAALTFDDGPHPSGTPSLLRVLADLDVRATFFLIGSNAVAQPELCRALVAAGMQIGNHSMRHVRLDHLDYARRAAATAAVVHAYRAAGFRFVTLSELLASIPLHDVNAARPLRVAP